MDELFGSVVGIIFFVIACLIVGALVGDIIGNGLHLYTFIDMSSTTQYRGDGIWKVSDRGEFKDGFVDNSADKEHPIFTINNHTKTAIDFSKAYFFAFTKDWAKYKLKVINVINEDYGKGSYILNPEDSIMIICQLPNRLIDNNSDIIGFKIELGWFEKIRFGYLPTPFWKDIYEDDIKPLIDKIKSLVLQGRVATGY